MATELHTLRTRNPLHFLLLTLIYLLIHTIYAYDSSLTPSHCHSLTSDDSSTPLTYVFVYIFGVYLCRKSKRNDSDND